MPANGYWIRHQVICNRFVNCKLSYVVPIAVGTTTVRMKTSKVSLIFCIVSSVMRLNVVGLILPFSILDFYASFFWSWLFRWPLANFPLKLQKLHAKTNERNEMSVKKQMINEFQRAGYGSFCNSFRNVLNTTYRKCLVTMNSNFIIFKFIDPRISVGSSTKPTKHFHSCICRMKIAALELASPLRVNDYFDVFWGTSFFFYRIINENECDAETGIEDE